MNPGDANEFRGMNHCGFMAKKHWKRDKPILMGKREESAFGGQGWSCEYCPGYVARMPLVTDAARAHLWFSKHQLHVIHPQPTQAVAYAAELLTKSYALFESECLSEKKSQ